jgi:hypothetical protein
MLRKLAARGSLTCAFILALCCSVPAQPQAQSGLEATARTVAAKDSGKEAPELSEAQKLAFQMLEASEGAARGFEPAMRSYDLLQIGSTLATLDAGRARQLLREAFTASLEIQDTDVIRPSLQRDILNTLLPLSQTDVEELVSRAEPRVRNSTAAQLVANYAGKKQFDKGVELVNEIAAVDEFPYEPGGRLIAAMPPEMAAEKQALFTQAVASYKNHTHPDTTIGGPTLTGMIIRVGLTMPPKLVLQAIDEILSQAKAKADQPLSLAGAGGRASFANEYQYQLFSLLPTLRALDESRAKQFLDENQDLQAKMQQFPDGMNSLMPPPPAANTKGAGNAASAPPVTNIRDYVRREMQSKLDAISQEAETDPVQAIAQCMTLPLEIDDGPRKSSPRSDALLLIARASAKKNSTASAAAMTELRKAITGLPPQQQAQYLSSAASLYLQMDDKDNADKVVSEGFKVAEKLLEQDTNPDSPNEALKAFWPSTDAYRRFVQLEARISDRAAFSVLKEIKDPEIRAAESILLARSLLGLPLKWSTVLEKRAGKTTSLVSLEIN